MASEKGDAVVVRINLDIHLADQKVRPTKWHGYHEYSLPTEQISPDQTQCFVNLG